MSTDDHQQAIERLYDAITHDIEYHTLEYKLPLATILGILEHIKMELYYVDLEAHNDEETQDEDN
jgi:hypothetical protein